VKKNFKNERNCSRTNEFDLHFAVQLIEMTCLIGIGGVGTVIAFCDTEQGVGA